MKQKLGLASALVTRPKVLLLDEPTTGVDPVTRQDFWQLLIRLVTEAPQNSAAGPETGTVGEGVAVLLSTPYMDEAARCQRVGFMRNGRMVAEGTPSQLRSSLENRIVEVRGTFAPSLRQAVGRIPGVEDVRAFGDKLHLRVVHGGADSVIAALEQGNLAGVRGKLEGRPVPPSLEDVFISLSEPS